MRFKMSKHKPSKSISKPSINKGTFKQRKIMQASWVLATWFLSEVVATHNWYDQIKSEKFQDMQVFLSSMLMMQDQNNLHYSRNKTSRYMVESFLDNINCKVGETKKVMIVQVMNDFEFNVEMPGTHHATVANVNQYIGNSRRVRQNRREFVLYKSEFAIPDFTHGPDPTEKIHEDFRRFIGKYEEVKPDVVDIHCKAGKNRSFKVMTAFTAYKELKDQRLDAAILVEKVHEISKRIASVRTCVSFQKKNQATHLAFAAQLAARTLGLDITVADIKRHVAVSLLQEYKQMRECEQENYGQLYDERFANPHKLPAVNKLIDELKKSNRVIDAYTDNEVKALTSDRLGMLVGYLKKLNDEHFDVFKQTQFSEDLQAFQESQGAPYLQYAYSENAFLNPLLG